MAYDTLTHHQETNNLFSSFSLHVFLLSFDYHTYINLNYFREEVNMQLRLILILIFLYTYTHMQVCVFVSKEILQGTKLSPGRS